MKSFVISALIAFLILNFQTIKAQPDEAVSYTIPTLNQMPVNAIHRIFQDSEGYMWYGTSSGLCRDDGYKIKVFRSDFNTPGAINENTIQCIAEDHNGRIWFGTYRGAYILDKKRGYSIKPLSPEKLSNEYINGIWCGRDGYMWISVYGKLIKYDISGKPVKSYPTKHYNGRPTYANGYCESRQMDLWVTCSNGPILKYDKEEDVFKEFATNEKRYLMTCIIQDLTDDYFWIGTWGDGLIRFDPWETHGKIFKDYKRPVNSRGQEEPLVIYAIQDKKDKYIWTTTQTDLFAFRYDSENDALVQTDIDFMSRNSKMLNDIITDRYGNIWVAAFDIPSFTIKLSDKNIQKYSLQPLEEKVGFTPAIMAICDAGQKKLWLSQERTGLVLYDLRNDDISLYTDFEQLKKEPLYAIKQMYSSNETGCVWIIPEGKTAIYKLSRNGMSMELRHRFTYPNDRYSVFTFAYEDNNGTLWIGTDRGFLACNADDGTIKSSCDTLGQITSIKEVKDGTLLMSTINNGLFVTKNSKTIKHYLQTKAISSMAVSQNKTTAWIGTAEGQVLSLDIKTGTTHDHTKSCGLKGDAVNQLLVDAYDHVWIDTNQKIIEYNPKNKSLSSYPALNGPMTLYRFLPSAACMSLDGKILFGGIPGIYEATPSGRLDMESSDTKVTITDISIRDSSLVFTGNGWAPNSRITFKYDDTDLKISFSTLDHTNASNIRYAYRLKGIDKEWTFTEEGENTAAYKHLPEGNYVFEVKATDRYGVWSKNTTTVSIVCTPPFYRTWWAYTLYISAGIVLLTLTARHLVRKTKKESEELYSDSVELMKMKNYLDNSADDKKSSAEVSVSNIEFAQLDKILLDKILKTVEENLSEPDFDVNALAQSIGMSRSSLSRKLKSITGLTPLEYIKKIKMQHAKKMLEDPNKNVSDVAMMLGYFNRKHFTGCFKDEFGITPSEYQKNIHGVEMEQKGDKNG